jgi:hypothetical protein
MLAGGHGIGDFNLVQGGSTSTDEHGWFAKNELIGGSGPNDLIGRSGHVTFKPSSSSQVIFAGTSDITSDHGHHRINPPRGTFYKSVKGRLVPIQAPPPKLIQTTAPSRYLVQAQAIQDRKALRSQEQQFHEARLAQQEQQREASTPA